ncbi:hypothetical protein F4818DRAFT_446033 [Hypoxylon cercidicola]|nr:hypothetical protein F4818DRAFT_446033 [Hypoxylon cercidicola]
MKMLIIAGAFLVAFLGQGSAQDTGLNACASGCVNGVFLNAESMGCAMNDRVCVCGHTADFTDGIRDCINQVCGSDAATQLPIAQSYGSDQCKAASSAAGLLPTATPTASSSPSLAQTTSSAQVTQPTAQAPANTASVTGAETTVTPGQNPGPTSTTGVASSAAFTVAGAVTTNSAAVSSASAAPESSSVGPSSPDSSASASSDSASTTSGDADTPTGTSSAEESGNASPTPESSSQDAMTVAVRAGIGAGVGVAVVLLAILAAWLCMRRRKQKDPSVQAPSMQISQPLPGSGRQYGDMNQAEAGLSTAFVTSSTTRDLHQVAFDLWYPFQQLYSASTRPDNFD